MASTRRVQAEFVELWSSLSSFWGVSPATARVYGWLLSRAEPQTAEACVDQLGLSRGAVSMAFRELRDWGLVLVQHGPGTRLQIFRPETNLEKVIRNIVAMRKRREWDPILDRLREWLPELERDGAADAVVFRQRLQQIEDLIGLADSMAESFLAGGRLQQLGLKWLVARAKAAGSKRRKR